MPFDVAFSNDAPSQTSLDARQVDSGPPVASDTAAPSKPEGGSSDTASSSQDAGSVLPTADGGLSGPLFVGSGEPGLFVSTDGKAWRPIPSPGPPPPSPDRFTFFGQLIFASGQFIGSGAGIWISSNGVGYERVFPEPGTRAGSVSNLVDAGQYLLAKHSNRDPGDPLSTGTTSWIISEDGGRTWRRRGEDNTGLSFGRIGAKGDVLVAQTSSSSNQEALIWVSLDRALTWEPARLDAGPVKNAAIRPVWLHGLVKDRFVATSTNGRWYESSNGKDWTFISMLDAPGFAANDALVINPVLEVYDRIWARSEFNNRLYASADNAKTWKLAGGFSGTFLTYGAGVYVASPGDPGDRSRPHYASSLEDGWYQITWSGAVIPSFSAVAFGTPPGP